MLIALVSGCTTVKEAKRLTAQELFNQYISATYGEKGLNAFSAVTISGKMEVEGTVTPFTIRQMAPDNRSFVTEMMGGVVGGGCSNQKCWRREPFGQTKILVGEELNFELSQADYYKLSHMNYYYKSLEIIKGDEDSAFPFYQVIGIRNDDSNDMYIFSKDTHMLKSIAFNITKSELTITIHHDDYKKFNGIVFPTKVVNVMNGLTMIMTIEQVEFDRLNISDFDIPVKATVNNP
jgi:hypothetical protein